MCVEQMPFFVNKIESTRLLQIQVDSIHVVVTPQARSFALSFRCKPKFTVITYFFVNES